MEKEKRKNKNGIPSEEISSISSDNKQELIEETKKMMDAWRIRCRRKRLRAENIQGKFFVSSTFTPLAVKYFNIMKNYKSSTNRYFLPIDPFVSSKFKL